MRGQAALHRHRWIRTQRFHPSIGALKADTGHIREKVCGTWCSRGSATSTKHLTKSEAFRSEKFGTLTGEYEQAAVDLCEMQERLRDEGGPTEEVLPPNVERRLRAEVRLQVETQVLRKGDELLIERDGELAEVSSQLAELQTLFDVVCHQLHMKCKRIEGLQETVNACVKQSKELEAIHHNLEESHQMLTQMRDTRAW